ncbi:Flp family type IVb pilin [Bosea lathyri]|uniref:Pilus assembly protein Flp/PilA n=1 Tax=Bosea lathyri TaxID=1036778 RepID=A0A1H5T7I2_9HYPH|nr:Flp family type IVb pilin [Bosea lathyri]SEF58765.1 pilus assembly protein Flp/PilA [Bosea lathyri]
MERIRVTCLRLVRDERGVTAIEYALVASIVSIVIVTSVTLIGTKVNSFLVSAANAFVTP